MRHYLSLMIGSLVLTFPAAAASMEPSPIQVSAKCRNNEHCIFDNRTIVVDLTITNVSNRTVGFPIEFIDRKGPYCTLTDNETGKEIVLRVGLPKRALMHQFTQIPPGGSISTEKEIGEGAISTLREKLTDLTAEFTIGAPFKLEGAAEPVYLLSGTTLRIIGRDKAERERKRADPNHP